MALGEFYILVSLRVAGLLCTLCSLQAFGQISKPTADNLPVEPSELAQVPKVPGVTLLLPGVNVGVTFSAVHDSGIGWYNLVTPAVSYTVSPPSEAAFQD
jgi:hypothetical protein